MLVQVFSSIDFNTFFDPARLLLKWQNTRPYPTLLNLIKDDLVHLAVNFSSAAHSTMSRKENFNAFPNFFWPFHKLSQVHPNPIARNSHLYRHECKNIVLNPCHVWINHVNLYHSFHFFFLSVPWSQEGINWRRSKRKSYSPLGCVNWIWMTVNSIFQVAPEISVISCSTNVFTFPWAHQAFRLGSRQWN